MISKNSLRPNKGTLIRLMKEHREAAKKETNPYGKKIHWQMAFDYLNDIRIFYGPNPVKDAVRRQAER